MKLWKVETGELIRAFDGPPSKVSALAFSPDGAHILSTMGKVPGPPASGDKEMLRLWESQDRLARTFRDTPVGARGDRALGLWETATGRLVRTFEPRSAGITAAAFSRDGRCILVTDNDGAITIWAAQTGAPVATLFAVLIPPGLDDPMFGKYEWVAVTPEGFFDASDKGAELLSIVRGLKVSAIDAGAYQVLHRPDLLRAKLAGDPDGKVKAAAAELEVKLRPN